MRSSDVVLIGLSAFIAVIGWTAAVLARPHVPHDRRVALWMLAPAAVLLPCAIVAVLAGAALAAAPLVSAALACGAASWIVFPTAGSRFAEFERQFWAHLRHEARADEISRR